jgi:Raf kinase inhibitor-like YbhB/YbcL family protein
MSIQVAPTRSRAASLFAAAFLLVLPACGDDADDDDDDDIDAAALDAADVDGAAIDAPAEFDAVTVDAGAFTLTSTAIDDGGTIPILYACHGDNISPPLAWEGAPEAAGFGLIFDDLDNGPNGFLHSVMFDIPPGVTSLPEDVSNVAEPKEVEGAKQTLGYDGATRGYLGPCPGKTHTYQFRLHAVDELPLPGVTLASSRAAVAAAIEEHSIGLATLTATYTPP